MFNMFVTIRFIMFNQVFLFNNIFNTAQCVMQI